MYARHNCCIKMARPLTVGPENKRIMKLHYTLVPPGDKLLKTKVLASSLWFTNMPINAVKNGHSQNDR